jgi:outer membrane protein assembly factor BamB
MKFLALFVLMISFVSSATAHEGLTRMDSQTNRMEKMVVAQDGTLLLVRLTPHNDPRFPSAMTEVVNQIYAFNPDGQTRWTLPLQHFGEDLVMHGQMLTTESLVIFALRERHVHTRRIIPDHPGEGNSSEDNEIHLVALDLASGEIIWQLTLDSLTPVTPAFDENHEQLYALIVRNMRDDHGDHRGDMRDHNQETILMAINFQGEMVWERTLDN